MNNKKLLAASMAAAISGGMVAQVHAIKVQENGIGQLLLGSTYMASGDLTTNIVVVNTRTDAAVKAKIVFREGINSSEVLDFVLYLTPGDVWRGEVKGEVNAAKIYSTDDSALAADGNFASESNPLDMSFFDKESSGQNGYGHFEVFGVYSLAAGDYDTNGDGTTDVTVKATMSKSDLKKVIDATTAAGGPGSDAAVDGCSKCTGTTSAVNPGNLQIMGEVGIAVSGVNSATYRMTALGPNDYNWGNVMLYAPNNTNGTVDTPVSNTANCATAAPYTCFSNYVVTNTNFDAVVSADTPIGQSMGVTGSGDTADHVIAIEYALASKDTVFPYNVSGSGSTGLMVTFPTKYRHRGSNVCSDFSGGTAQGVSNNEYTAPFDNTTSGIIEYSITSYDNSENSAVQSDSPFSGGTAAPSANFPTEVNYITPTYYSTSGQARVEFKADNVSTGCDTYYMGVPAINSVLKGNTAGTAYNIETAGDRRQGM